MKIRDIMSKPAVTCRANDTLEAAAHLMWEHDCGAIPVVSEDERVVGMITDRDVCMAAYTQGKTLRSIPLSRVMATKVHTCRSTDALETAERVMHDHQIRRVPIVDEEGRAVGIVSLNDIARYAAVVRGKAAIDREVTQTLAAICEPRVRAAAAPAHLRATAAE